MDVNLRMINLFERVLKNAPEDEDRQEFAEARDCLKGLYKQVAEDMREQLDVLEECCDAVTPAPWCAFSDDGGILAIMPAGRPGDVFKFEEPPKEADAHYVLLAQPHYIKAMIQRIRQLETQVGIEEGRRWTKEKDDANEEK